MILRLVKPMDIVKIHKGMHREATHQPNFAQLVDICSAVDREYFDYTVNLDSIFSIAAEYAIRLAHTEWTEDTNRAAETAFAVCLLFLNQYGIPMKGNNQILFNVMRDEWTTVDKFAPRLMLEHAKTIISNSKEPLTAGDALEMTKRLIHSPIRFGPLITGLRSLRESFTVSGCKGVQWDNYVND